MSITTVDTQRVLRAFPPPTLARCHAADSLIGGLDTPPSQHPRPLLLLDCCLRSEPATRYLSATPMRCCRHAAAGPISGPRSPRSPCDPGSLRSHPTGARLAAPAAPTRGALQPGQTPERPSPHRVSPTLTTHATHHSSCRRASSSAAGRMPLGPAAVAGAAARLGPAARRTASGR